MRLLLDTHILLWAITADRLLPDAARHLIEDSRNEVVFSAASVWEITIKHSIRSDAMPVSGAEALHWFRRAGYRELSITPEHTVVQLEPIHRDPFDRMLVAQALAEPLRLVTHDEVVARYSDTVILV
ncbi:MAG: type II toxin-antitoxin system VapC family toxin [Spirochaetaceae bacterium]|nr:MAG: type II toxin-antitoxin system VapC family toxin [Spirochaetaceae bacterium]